MVAGVLLSSATLTAAAEDAWQPYVSLQGHGWSEPVAIHTAVNELRGELSGGDEAYTHNHLEAGARHGNWSFGALARYDYLIETHEDTLFLLHRSKNDLPVPTATRFRFDGRVSHMRAIGIRMAHVWTPHPAISLTAGAAYLRADRVLDGEVSGVLETLADGRYVGAAEVDYVYTDDVLLDREVNDARGVGYSLDIAIDWRVTRRLRLSAQVADAYARIRWSAGPFTRAELTSTIPALDADGRLRVSPALQGVEGERQFEQHLDPRVDVEAQYQLNERWALSAGAFVFRDFVIPEIGTLISTGERGVAYFGVKPSLGAAVFGYRNGAVDVRLALDHPNPREAHYVRFELAFEAGRG